MLTASLASSKFTSVERNPIAPYAKPELRVLQIFAGLGVGGAETWLLSLLRYFRDAQNDLPVKVKFDILLTGGSKAVFDDEAIALGARLFYVPFRRWQVLSFIREFRSIIAAGNYDAIHDHQDYIAGLHFLMTFGNLPPVRVAHVHNPLYHRLEYANGPVRQLSKSAGKYLLGRLATNVLGTSRQIVTEYGFDRSTFSKVMVGAAHCGFDIARYRGDQTEAHAQLCSELEWDVSAKVILFVGRLDGAELIHRGQKMTHKNPAFALEVAKECIAADKRVRFVLVGDGITKQRELEALIDEWGLKDRIKLLGVRSDVPRLMLGSDLLLFPSVAEGLGMVVVEAQAAGLRVLASDTTPRECVVTPDAVQFLSLEASIQQWADDALRLINLPRLNATECNAFVRDSDFSIENSAANLIDIYRKTSSVKHVDA